MSSPPKSYVEHVAIRVRDLAWHVTFFREVFGQTIREVDGSHDAPRQVWTVGGIQLMADPEFAGADGRLGHLGVMTEDLEETLRLAAARGIGATSQGRNWLALPDGLVVEVIQAAPASVAAILSVDARAPAGEEK